MRHLIIALLVLSGCEAEQAALTGLADPGDTVVTPDCAHSNMVGKWSVDALNNNTSYTTENYLELNPDCTMFLSYCETTTGPNDILTDLPDLDVNEEGFFDIQTKDVNSPGACPMVNTTLTCRIVLSHDMASRDIITVQCGTFGQPDWWEYQALRQ